MEGGERSNWGKEEGRAGQWSVQYTCQTSSLSLRQDLQGSLVCLVGWSAAVTARQYGPPLGPNWMSGLNSCSVLTRTSMT